MTAAKFKKIRRFPALCLLAFFFLTPDAGAAPRSVCVSTLDNLDAAAESYWLGHFISDSIARNLAVLPGLKISRPTGGGYTSTGTCPTNVDFLVGGSFSGGGDAVVVRAHCIRQGGSSRPGAASFVSSLSDLYPHLVEMSVSLAGFSGTDYSHAELAQIRRPPTSSPKAIVLYGKAMASPREELGMWLLRAISEDPSYTDALSKLGIHYYETDRIPAAQVAFKRLLEVDPHYPNLYYNLGLIYRASGDYSRAIEMYRRAVELRPLDSEAWNNLGAVYYLTEKRDDAAGAFEQALRLDPENPRAQANLSAALRPPAEKADRMTHRRSDIEQLRRHVATGAACYANGDYWCAAEESEKALEIDPENFNANFNAGLAYLGLGKLEEAREYFERALRVDRTAEQVRENLAKLPPAREETQFAGEQQADSAGEILDPLRKARALAAAGRIHLARGSYELAADRFSQVIQLLPDDPASITGLGLAYFGLAEYEMAREQFSLAAGLEHEDGEAKKRLAETEYVLYGKIENHQQGEQAEKHPSPSGGLSLIEARACVVRGNRLTDDGRYTEAVAEYHRALDFAPALTEALNNLAYAYHRLGEHDRARMALQKARLLEPENDLVARNSEALDSAFAETGDAEPKPLEIFVPGSKTEEEPPKEPALTPSSDAIQWEALNYSNVPPDPSERRDVPHPAE